ncbi:hypothetical protein SESBI_23528 [Sesbania bispinosa]|nr:hypothetical protein SESBI_23528 [Sesbania bispinosa]
MVSCSLAHLTSWRFVASLARPVSSPPYFHFLCNYRPKVVPPPPQVHETAPMP